MRALLAGCALLIVGTVAAEAQPFFGGPPGYGYGYGWHRRHWGPPPGYGFYGPGPRWGYGRRCWIVEGYYGPRRVCRRG